jgi:transmembrane sensor
LCHSLQPAVILFKSFFFLFGTSLPILLSYLHMQEERFWLLASLRLSGEASPEEQAELSELLAQHPEMTLRLEIFTNIWRQQHPGNPPKRQDAFNKHLQRLSTHLSDPVLQNEDPAPGPATGQPATGQPVIIQPATSPTPARTGRLRHLWIAATAAAACITIAFILTRYTSNGGKSPARTAFNTVSTRPGSKTKISLPDGTQVFLNADSRLTYNESFTGASREVQLTGEAYFDVAKDAQHPFLIHTPGIDIRVIGTAFNVRSYSNERNTTTALFQGSVEVTLHNNPDKKIILKPNEKLIVQNDQRDIDGATPAEHHPDDPLMILGKVHFQKKDSSITETLWTKNQLAFDGATLEEVGWQIERWYDVKVHITAQELKRLHFTAIFQDESLPQVMEALRITGNFNYSIHKKDVTIAP